MAHARIAFVLGYFPCDRCKAPSLDAWYKVRTGELFTLCGHHSIEYCRALQARRFKIIMTRGT